MFFILNLNFIESLKDVDFTGKSIALFGYYDWGAGEWMRSWEQQMKEYGATLVEDGLNNLSLRIFYYKASG